MFEGKIIFCARKKGGAVMRRDDYIMLVRIIATLLAMASLAERLVGAPAIVRRITLHFLRRAEAVGREFLIGEAGSRNLRNLPTPLEGSGPEDALRLASCFRALALALEAVLVGVAGHVPSQARVHQFYRLAPRKFAPAPACVFDTS
jgi:hypothetical protein